MKKFFALALALVMTLSLAACGNSNTAAGSSSTAAGSSSSAAMSSSSAASSSAATSTPAPAGESTLTVDMNDTISSMGDAAGYISNFTMTYHFQDDAVSSITEEITLQDKISDTQLESLKSSLASQGTVAVDGNVATVTLSDISAYDGMTQDQVKTALETAGFTVTQG